MAVISWIPLFVLLAAAPGHQRSAPDWERQFEGNILDVSSPSGRPCLAVLTSGEVSVIGDDGVPRWRRDFRKFSRIFQAETVAVAPSCDWVVVTGNASYRYAWLLRRDGRDEYIGFKGETPLSAAVHPNGHQVAVSTGGSRIHLASSDPFVTQRRVSYSDGGGRLDYPSADTLVVSRYGAGVLTATGKIRWAAPGGVCHVSWPRDMSWTVAACSPPHFSSTGRVTLRAPDGHELWSRVLDMPHAAAAPDGSFLAVLGADVEVTGAKEVAGPRRLMTLRPTGELIREQREPEDTTLVGVTGNGTIILRSYRAASVWWVTADGGRRGALDLTVDLPVSALLTGTSRLLVWDRHRLQLFTIPD